jgi:hypothetical protein
MKTLAVVPVFWKGTQKNGRGKAATSLREETPGKGEVGAKPTFLLWQCSMDLARIFLRRTMPSTELLRKSIDTA